MEQECGCANLLDDVDCFLCIRVSCSRFEDNVMLVKVKVMNHIRAAANRASESQAELIEMTSKETEALQKLYHQSFVAP